MTHSSPENAEMRLIEAGDDLYSAFCDYGKTKGQIEALTNYANASNAYRGGVIRAQQTASPANAEPQGYTESEGYAASLRQQADLMEKANAGKVSAYVAIDDFDVDELRDAADFIERIITQPTAPPENAGWTPDQFWEYVGGLAGEFEAGQMRDMMVSHGLSLGISAQQMPDHPTEAMLNAARDWSIAKYGRGIGNDAAIGCWQAMLAASFTSPECPPRTCATCHAVLADGPQPAATYSVEPQRIPPREEMAGIVYEGAHKSLKNCWKWTDDGLDAEHPGRRGYYYKIADAVLAALSRTRPECPPIENKGE